MRRAVLMTIALGVLIAVWFWGRSVGEERERHNLWSQRERAFPDLLLPQPAQFPEIARDLLRRRMLRHGEETQALLAAVLRLDHPKVQEYAAEIASEPRIARPFRDGEDVLNDVLPERFFELQQQLSNTAGELSEIARTHDDAKVARAFSDVVGTCVECHSVYLFDTPTTSAQTLR